MTIQVLVPRLGQGVEEVTVTKWLKREGQLVQALEPLLEVNTDKVDTEIPSPANGVILKIVIPEGAPARVGEVLALIGDTVVSASTPKAESQAQAAPPPQNAAHKTGFISPVVARIAAEQKVNLQQIQGSGLNGRITKEDVLDFAARQNTQTAAPLEKTLIPLSDMRQQIARRMVESRHTSPHVLTVMEADLSQVTAHRLTYREQLARDGVRLTFTTYFMMALAASLKAYPLANSSWTEDGILQHPAIHLGMATSLGADGLIVPVIKNADELSLPEMARSINDLAKRARASQLQPDEVRGGTFTLTNHGIHGSLFGMPIINQPQSGILGVGAIQKRAVVVSDARGDSIAIRPMVYLSYVFDHRILDGASADGFLMKVKETLESWPHLF